MKKIIIFIITVIFAASSVISASAAPIPRETAPEGADEAAIQIAENLIGGILDEVYAGTGYGSASARANTKIRKAVMNGETGGYGYGVLSPISQNAIRIIRDMYLRSDYYTQLENKLNVLLADLIIDVQNGKDYDTAYTEAKTRIYQSAEPTYNPNIDRVGDFCDWNIPPVDSAELTVVRKLLINARNVYLQK